MGSDVLIATLITPATNPAEFIGLALPPVIALINKDVKTETQRFWVSVFICLLVAVLLKWQDLAYGSPQMVLYSFGLVFAESQIVFKTYFKDSWLDQKISGKDPEVSLPDPTNNLQNTP